MRRLGRKKSGFKHVEAWGSLNAAEDILRCRAGLIV
jgi:hypothetical protein